MKFMLGIVRSAALNFICIFVAITSSGQVLIDGRIGSDRWAGSGEKLYFGGVYCFANVDGPGSESRSFRSWETDPAGWYRVSGGAGNYTMLFSEPAGFLRPMVLNNVFTEAEEKLIGLPVSPQWDFHSFGEKEWDPKPARAYYQIFVAKGRSVTSAGFKLATDGVDGFGPKSQNLLVSIHRRGPGSPDRWPQVGPTAPVLDVDCGGAKNYAWSAGWNSGEVPLAPEETYAVCLRAENPENGFQAFWRRSESNGCFRVAENGVGFEPRQLWMAIGTDSDGLLIPYNKHIQKQFGQFAGFAHRWSQSYVAQGRSLAGVVLYAAVGGAQPPLSRQRVMVRARRDGPGGPQVGIEKIAVGNGNYTGDASWGVFGTAFAPGEVPLTPGSTYALEFESIENYETLHGFVNIKKQVSDDRPGFNPYRKHSREPRTAGNSFKMGTEPQGFDLDMQIIEYEAIGTNFSRAVDRANLLQNGDFSEGKFDIDSLPAAASVKSAEPPQGQVAGWTRFSLSPSTMHAHLMDQTNSFVRVFGVGKDGINGGFVQRVDGLNRFETYRLFGKARSSWPVDFEHRVSVGCDATGQETNAEAKTIAWTQVGKVHGVWESFESRPIRPASSAISVWLRAQSNRGDPFAFKADFDGLALRHVHRKSSD